MKRKKNKISEAKQELISLFTGVEAAQTLESLKAVKSLALYSGTNDLYREDLDNIWKLEVICENLEVLATHTAI